MIFKCLQNLNPIKSSITFQDSMVRTTPYISIFAENLMILSGIVFQLNSSVPCCTMELNAKSDFTDFSDHVEIRDLFLHLSSLYLVYSQFMLFY